MYLWSEACRPAKRATGAQDVSFYVFCGLEKDFFLPSPRPAGVAVLPSLPWDPGELLVGLIF